MANITETMTKTDLSPEQKQARWQQLREEFSHVTDRLGIKIDPGILEAVIAFNALGINTRQSCEGHLNRGSAAPWIDVETKEDITELEKRIDEAFRMTEQQEKSGASEEELDRLYADTHRLNLEVRRKNLEEVKKTMVYLEEFYHERTTPYDVRLVINFRGRGIGHITNQGAEFQETADENIKQQKLKSYQQEMQDFTVFLKEKFFSD